MREKLKELGSADRHMFTAEVVRFGKKNGWVGDLKTVLLKNVTLGDKIVCDHIWFTCGKQFEDLSLNTGDKISFLARVSKYVKGYKGWREDVFDHPIETDYGLSRPTKIRKVFKQEESQDNFLFGIG